LDTEEIVQSVANGMDATLIEPRLFPIIYPLLNAKYSQLLRAGNTPAAQSVQSAICVLARREENEKRRQLEQESQSKKPDRKSLELEEKRRRRLEDPRVLKHGVRRAMSGRFREIDPDLYDIVIKELRQRHAKSLQNRDWVNAGKYDRVARKMHGLVPSNKYEEFMTTRVNAREEQLAAARERLAVAQVEWRDRISEAKIQSHLEIERLRAGFESQLAEFDNKFQMTYPLEYRKYSPMYLQLKQQEKFMSLTKRFREAKELGIRAANLGKTEEVEFQKQYIFDLDLKRADMVQKMQDKITAKEQSAADDLFILQRESELALENLELAVKAVEIQSEQVDLQASLVPDFGGCSPLKSRVSMRPSSDRRTRGRQNSRQGSKFLCDDELSPQHVFGQRRAINAVVYTLPRI
jgi:hypothetical protein